jgi:hypothetical protein
MSERRIPSPPYVQRIGAEITGREQGVIVTPRLRLQLTGCDGLMTSKQAAAARTLLDGALEFIAEQEGPQADGRKS